jgi:hypothetical protein
MRYRGDTDAGDRQPGGKKTIESVDRVLDSKS